MDTKEYTRQAILALVPKCSFRLGDNGELLKFNPPHLQPTDEAISLKIVELKNAKAAREDQNVKDEGDKAIVTGSSDIRALVQMSPSQIEDWAEANVKTLKDAKDLLVMLTKVVSILAKREFR